MNDGETAASSATYRKATNMLADELDIEPKHSTRPSRDFERTVDQVSDELRRRARRYYRRGIQRGFIAACNQMLSGQLEFKDKELHLHSKKVRITVNLRYGSGDDKVRETFIFSPKKLDFE